MDTLSQMEEKEQIERVKRCLEAALKNLHKARLFQQELSRLNDDFCRLSRISPLSDFTEYFEVISKALRWCYSIETQCPHYLVASSSIDKRRLRGVKHLIMNLSHSIQKFYPEKQLHYDCEDVDVQGPYSNPIS